MTPAMGKERPIPFTGAEVRAILAGTKTQTRRIVKPQPKPDGSWDWAWPIVGPGITKGTTVDWRDDSKPTISMLRQCPYGAPGDQLWVRETLRRPAGDASWWYAADNQAVVVAKEDVTAMRVWAHHKSQDHCVSIHMPRWASRITLEITGVRVERLHDISDKDCFAEGLQQAVDNGQLGGDGSVRGEYRALWESINGKDSWSLNPWVWVIEFQRWTSGEDPHGK